jgi:hypothetical protein
MKNVDAGDVTAVTEARRDYERQWRRNNPERLKAIKERFWAKRALPGEDVEATRRRYIREWRAANKEKIRETTLRYWAKRGARLKAKKDGTASGEVQ